LGTDIDLDEAVKWYAEGSELGDAVSTYNLACCYQMGDGVAPDEQKAATLFLASARSGYIQAIHSLALTYEYGRGHTQSSNEALRWYKESAPKEGGGILASHYNLARLLLSGHVTPDDARAYSELEYLSNAPCLQTSAMSLLAWMLCHGRGPRARDPRAAMAHYAKAAQRGHIGADKALRMLQANQNARPPLPDPDPIHGNKHNPFIHSFIMILT
jgi:TPR repeat protein